MKILLPLLALFLLFQSCDILVSPEEPDAQETKKQLKDINQAKDYSKIRAVGVADISLQQGDKHKIVLRGNKSHFKYLIFKMKGNTLVCDTYDDLPSRFDVNIQITMPTVTDIDLSGAGQIQMGHFTKIEDLDLDLSGAGTFETKGRPTSVTHLDISISGAGSVEAESLLGDDVEVSVSGAGSAEVHAIKTLDAEVSGVGSIEYSGNPRVRKNVSGIGSISKM